MNNSEAQRKKMLEGKIPSIVTRMALPSVAMMIVTLIYNTVDTYFVAKIDKSAAAAVGAVFAIQAVIQAVGFGFGMGVSSLCSRKLGKGADDEATEIVSSGIFGVVCVATVIEILGLIFLKPLLNLVGCTESMYLYARDYALMILLFAPVACVGNVMGNMFKSEGHMTIPLYASLASAIINVILDPIFIFSLNLKTMGAALATSISQVVSLVIFILQIQSGKTIVRPSIKKVSRKISTYLQIISTGIPTVFRQGLASLASALLCRHASVYGDAVVAAVTISNKCYMLIRNVIIGIGQGTQPVAGYNYGAGLWRRAKAAFDFAIIVGTAICLVASVLTYSFANEIMWWFCKDEEVLIYGVDALRYASLVIPVMAISTYINQEYQSLGYRIQATILAACRQGICFVPVIFLLPHLLGVTGVEMAQPVADLLTFVISVPFYFVMARKLCSKK